MLFVIEGMTELSPQEWDSNLGSLWKANTADTIAPRNWALLLQEVHELQQLNILPHLLQNGLGSTHE